MTVENEGLPEHERVNWIASIFGQKGSGKSWLAKEIADMEERVIVIDNLGEYKRLQVVWGYEECIKALVSVEKLPKFKLALRTPSVAFDLELIDLVFKMTNVTLIVEETSRYVSPSSLPEPMEQLVRFGRHQAINMVWLARRPSEIHRDLTAQSDTITTFVQHELRDLQYLRSFMGRASDGIESLRGEPYYDCLTYGPDSKMPWPIFRRKYQGDTSKELDTQE